MANYRLGDIIKLTRKTMGMSQEELAFLSGIAAETVSRIELGKHKITQSTYQRIMETLNCDTERCFAICTSEEVGILEEKKMFESAQAKFAYKEAGEYLRELKRKTTGNLVNEQYIKRAEVLQAYEEGRIDDEILLEELQDALRMSVDDYEQYLECKNYKEEGYPFRELELIILMNIATAYEKLKNYTEARKILIMILDCIDAGYIDGKKVRNLKLLVKRNLSRTLASVQRYEEVIALLEETQEEMLKNGYGLGLPIVLYDIGWYMDKVNQIKGEQIYGLEEIKKKKRQAYYIAVARKDNYVAEFAKASYEKMFHEHL